MKPTILTTRKHPTFSCRWAKYLLTSKFSSFLSGITTRIFCRQASQLLAEGSTRSLGKMQDTLLSNTMQSPREEAERVLKFCTKLLEERSNTMNCLQETLAKCVVRLAQAALQAPAAKSQEAYGKFENARDCLSSTIASEMKFQHVVNDLKVMQMYRYGTMYHYTRLVQMNEYFKRAKSTVQHPSLTKDGYPGPSSLPKLPTLTPLRQISQLLEAPQSFMHFSEGWWKAFVDAIEDEYSFFSDGQTNGKGKRAQPKMPYLRQLREVLELTQESDLGIVLDTVNNYVRRHDDSPKLQFEAMINDGCYEAVVNLMHNDLMRLDGRLPNGFDPTTIRELVRATRDRCFVTETDEKTGKLLSWSPYESEE
ncbi:hypothetical protein BJ170DRAFT_642421 [Xylariales sp. AK1849]|nr:hypothetical protein BJ170DRAFT_642421 [Xylariales sp. AK1849]